MRKLLILSSCQLLVFSFLAFASGCPVGIKNIEFCADKGLLGATCAYWLNAKETRRKVKKAQWDKQRLGMFCTSAAGMGQINATIEALCQNRECVEKVNELIKALKE